MSDSPLSFGSSSSFRNNLLTKNLEPYNVPGVYTPPSGQIVKETILTVSSVVDSPDNLIADSPFGDLLYPLNEYGPDGGFNTNITFNGPPLPVNSNQGEYNPNDTVLDLVNEFFIDAAYIENKYGPQGGFEDMVIITDIQNKGKIYQPYWNPPSFVPSIYTAYNILLNADPVGSDGLLSQDSYIAKLSAGSLNFALRKRIDAETYQNTAGVVTVNFISNPYEASSIGTGQQPFVFRDYRITVPEDSTPNQFDLTTRLQNTYYPTSLIPGDYFTETKPNFLSQQTTLALGALNQLTGGFLGPILNKSINSSEIFLANTGKGQVSFLFKNIDYNRYQPQYEQQFSRLANSSNQQVINSVNPDNDTLTGGYYVGSRSSEPSFIPSPPNQLPVDQFGRQIETLVYGPSELATLYEGNQFFLRFGLVARPIIDGGGVEGRLVWTSPLYRFNAGFKATPGGGTGSLDNEFNLISSQYFLSESTNITFKEGSILDDTQRLIDSADKVIGVTRLRHVGNAINQVSKVFNDGYKELTKGSQVLKYTDFTTGAERGTEYCRVFAKDTPYYTYNDLQKVDGITQSGRRFNNSVLDRTFNLNIAPMKGKGSTNIIPADSMGKNGGVKKYMFSIENLAWLNSGKVGSTYDDLPLCEKGPNGGRIMWFPPYDLKFDDKSSAQWSPNSFLGRPEPIYTYKNTDRSGSLSWTMIVDHPSVLNVLVNNHLKSTNRERINSILDSFFAGCVKYDIYELAAKYNQIPTRDLFYYQEILSNPRLTPEELTGVQKAIQTSNSGGQVQSSVADPSNSDSKGDTPDTSGTDFENKFNDLAFYFDNDEPNPNSNSTTTSVSYDETYSSYSSNFGSKYQNTANSTFPSNSNYCQKNTSYCNDQRNVSDFWNNIIVSNYDRLNNSTDGLVASMNKLIKEKNATIALNLTGAASALANPNYNTNLSSRRIESVRNYILKGLEKGFAEKVTINGVPLGETAGTGPSIEQIVIPKSIGLGNGFSVNCSAEVVDGNTGKQTQNSGIYSVNAMACRRVKISSTITIPPTETANKTDSEVVTQQTEPVKTIDSTTQVPKPVQTVTIEQKLKEGISKKILRQLLSECDYFEMIQQDVPMVYDSIREKIKYFNPAFHSMTPEGLNSRLTFLNQCVRPGETIPTIDSNGKSVYNDARNTSFGTPPVLILRIGDYFHTKIIPDSVSFTYEPLLDLNPEGIGVQPMIAKVQMGFKIIGGMGLKEPVEQLQNALSFNYYANTEIYDERAVPTEDVSKLDKQLVEKILAQQPTPKVQNQTQNGFGNTIGVIKTINRVEGGENGEISYGEFMDKFRGDTTNYFQTVTNQLESINSQSNYGVLQMINQNRDYKEGKLYTNGTEISTKIYGKPIISTNTNTNVFTDLINQAKSDVTNETNPILAELFSDPKKTTSTERSVIKTNMIKYLDGLNLTFSNKIQTIITDLTSVESEYTMSIRKIEIINGGTDGFTMSTDGKKLDTGVPLVYSITSGQSVYDELQSDVRKVYESLNNFDDLLITKKIITNTYSGVGNFVPISNNLEDTIPNKTFFMVVSRTLSDSNQLENFKRTIISPEISKNTKLVKNFNNIVDKLIKTYDKELNEEDKLFFNFKRSQEYTKFVNGADEIMYTLGKVRIMNYTTLPQGNMDLKKDKLKELYSTLNNGEKSTYLGKVKFD